jgi:hypothetical protein
MRLVDFVREFAKIILAIVAVEFIYWSKQDYVIFNDRFLNTLPLLYYSSVPLLAAFFLLILILIRNYSKTVIFNIFILLFGTYLLFSVDHLYGDYCVDFKNLNQTYFIINLSIIASIAILFFKIIAPYLSRRSIIVNSISFVILILDYYYFLVGFSFFYL